MGGKFSRDKGARFEREVIKAMQEVVDRVYDRHGAAPPKLRRNLTQYQSKNLADVEGLPWLAVECKHVEALSVASWWRQVLRAAKPDQIPVLIWKQNRKHARVMLPWHCDGWHTEAIISKPAFLEWLEWTLEKRLRDE